MKLLTLIVTLSSATVALSSPVPKASKWEHPKIDDMTPFECAVSLPSLPRNVHRLIPKQRKCFRRYSYIYDVESKTRKQYCDTESSKAMRWSVDYNDDCWTLDCGSDPWVTQDLVNSKSKCKLLSIRSHQLMFSKLPTGGSKISAADVLAKMARVDEKLTRCWWTSSLISIFRRISTVSKKTTYLISCLFFFLLDN